MKQPHKVMTAEEYATTPIVGWHMVCRNVDGMGNVGIRYQDRGQREGVEYQAQMEREYEERMRR